MIEALKESIKKLEVEQAALTAHILATPSGATRNALCDANIYLMYAMHDMRRVVTADIIASAAAQQVNG